MWLASRLARGASTLSLLSVICAGSVPQLNRSVDALLIDRARRHARLWFQQLHAQTDLETTTLGKGQRLACRWWYRCSPVAPADVAHARRLAIRASLGPAPRARLAGPPGRGASAPASLVSPRWYARPKAAEAFRPQILRTAATAEQDTDSSESSERSSESSDSVSAKPKRKTTRKQRTAAIAEQEETESSESSERSSESSDSALAKPKRKYTRRKKAETVEQMQTSGKTAGKATVTADSRQRPEFDHPDYEASMEYEYNSGSNLLGRRMQPCTTEPDNYAVEALRDDDNNWNGDFTAQFRIEEDSNGREVGYCDLDSRGHQAVCVEITQTYIDTVQQPYENGWPGPDYSDRLPPNSKWCISAWLWAQSATVDPINAEGLHIDCAATHHELRNLFEKYPGPEGPVTTTRPPLTTTWGFPRGNENHPWFPEYYPDDLTYGDYPNHLEEMGPADLEEYIEKISPFPSTGGEIHDTAIATLQVLDEICGPVVGRAVKDIDNGNGNEELVKRGVKDLSGLSIRHARRDEIREQGGIKALVSVLQKNSLNWEAQACATFALWEMAHFDVNRDVIREDGGIPEFVRMLRDGDVEAQEFAVAALSRMARDSQNQVIIREEGGIPLICRFAAKGSEKCPVPDRAASYAILALENLIENAENKALVLNITEEEKLYEYEEWEIIRANAMRMMYELWKEDNPEEYWEHQRSMLPPPSIEAQWGASRKKAGFLLPVFLTSLAAALAAAALAKHRWTSGTVKSQPLLA